jgi:uncharacterized membrane protein
MTYKTPPKSLSWAIKMNKLIHRMSRNWLRIVIVVLIVYVSLPFAAPTMMELGMEDSARFIYKIYGPFCHQFGFRSFFLYGDQAVYPRENTGTSLTPFESYVSDLDDFAKVDFEEFDIELIMAARLFIGNEQMGYKVTLCERDISIYIALLIGALIYSRPKIRRKIRPVPIWLYLFLGLAPIGLDGFSQLFGYPPFEIWPERETLPIFRVVTGSLFGIMNAWLAFPYLDRAFYDTCRDIEDKLFKVGVELPQSVYIWY